MHFNSRPHGGRLQSRHECCVRWIFQLTPSRRATSFDHSVQFFQCISTHALTEGDAFRSLYPDKKYISTHALTEGDLYAIFNAIEQGGISTHALTEGDKGKKKVMQMLNISTHALTEGDGKFRQIFLLNRGYAYSISLYFLPHFISLLPQILSFQQKSFKFQVRIFLLFSVHLAFALQNQCVHHVKSRFCTNMFYFVFVLFTQIVKPQTIGLFIYDFF